MNQYETCYAFEGGIVFEEEHEPCSNLVELIAEVKVPEYNPDKWELDIRDMH